MENKADIVRQKASILFSVKGIKATTMDELAQSLRISKKTIFKHFTDKDSLVRLISGDYLQQLKEGLLQLPFSNSSSGNLNSFFVYILGYYRLVTPIFITDLRCYYPSYYSEWSHAKMQILFMHFKQLITAIPNPDLKEDVNVEKIWSWYKWQLKFFSDDLEQVMRKDPIS